MRHLIATILLLALVARLLSEDAHAQVFPTLPLRPAIPTAVAPPAPTSAFGGSAGGPAPTGLAITGSEAFEVVPLKYADVSEIVGLLTANQAIKPNDNFTPEEPAFGSSGLQSGYYGAALTSSVNSALAQSLAQADSLGRAIDDNVGIDRRLNAIVLKGSPMRIAVLKEQTVDAVNLRHGRWTPRLVQTVHEAGMLAFAWDVNHAWTKRIVLRAGVDAIYSDHVSLLVS